MIWKPNVVVAAIVERDGRFLLVEEEADGETVLNQPAGHLDEGESLIEAVVRGLGVPFRPKAVTFVSELPKTRNLKIMRRVIRAAVLGEPPGDLSSLVNPEAVEEIRSKR